MKMSKGDIQVLRYGISLVIQETCDEIHNVKNKGNNIPLLSKHKKKLEYLNALDEKLKKIDS